MAEIMDLEADLRCKVQELFGACSDIADIHKLSVTRHWPPRKFLGQVPFFLSFAVALLLFRVSAVVSIALFVPCALQ
jgi:hypothetical protein